MQKKTNLQIALIDTKKLSSDWHAEKHDHRVSAISLASQRIFSHLGVWDNIKEKRVSPYQKMQIWDQACELQFDAKAIQEAQLGFIVEDNLMRACLLEKISELPNVHIYAPMKLIAFAENADGVELFAEDKQVLQSKLIIAADGGHSWMREQAQIEIKTWDYQHTAIVAAVKTTIPHQQTAWQRFLTSGPLAFLPLSDANQSSIVWSTSPEEAKIILALDEKAFKKRLASAFDYKLGEIIACEQRFSFPLQMRHAKNYVKSRVVLMGDAAHTIHPLAGQGVNLGLLDAACFVDTISQGKPDLTNPLLLRRYERWRKADNGLMLAFVEGIKYLFASEVQSISAVRNLGMNLTNRLDFVKNFFTNYACGNRTDIPLLAQH